MWLVSKWCQSTDTIQLQSRFLQWFHFVIDTKQLLPAYRVAANCNNSQGTKNVTMPSFPRNKPAVRRKWVKFVQVKHADCTDLASQHAHCVLTTSLSATSPAACNIRRVFVSSKIWSQQQCLLSSYWLPRPYDYIQYTKSLLTLTFVFSVCMFSALIYFFYFYFFT